MTRGLRAGILATTLALASATPAAAQDEQGFQAYLGTLRQQALAAGVTPRTVAAVFPTLTLSDRTIELDRAQPGNPGSSATPPLAPYRRSHVDAARIGRGRSTYQAQRARLARVERETGVPESIMVAIWGHETNYGAYTGNFDLLRSLASLAYEGRRRELFAGEFIAALKILDRGIPREQLKGSWAGATGNPQFLPSVYLRVARDGDGDGRADIWSSPADTLASIGNYFADAETLDRLEGEGRVAFRYAQDINGSARNIAGVMNAAGNVLGMMPHPERKIEAAHGGDDGRRLFEGLLAAVA